MNHPVVRAAVAVLVAWAGSLGAAGCGSQAASSPAADSSGAADSGAADAPAAKDSAALDSSGSTADAKADSAPDASAEVSDSAGESMGGADAGSADATDAAGADAAAAPAVALAELASATAAELCKANFAACTPAEKMPFATQAGCVAALTATNSVDFAALSALVKGGKVSYDAAAAGQCLALVAEHCDDLDLVDGPASCQAAFLGSAVNGSKCQYSVECASHFCYSDGVCAGVCKARVALGAACDEETDKCASGAACFGGKCVAKVAKGVGAACGALACATGLYCNSKNKCAALGKAGEACDIVGACVVGTQCIDSGSGGSCLPMPKKGQPCTPDPFSDASTQCASGLVCANDGGEVGTCEPQVPLGGACKYSSECGGWDVHCVGPQGGKVCQLLSAKGGPCLPGDLDQSEWGGCLAPWTCSKGICIDPPGLGQPCAEDILNACAEELMCDFLANKCIAIPVLGQECYGLCTTGLTCDESVIPNLCKAAKCP